MVEANSIVIHDRKELDKKIRFVSGQGVQYHANLHTVAVSVMWHLARHGQIASINNFYKGLTEAYKSAFRQYVGRHGGGLTDPNMTDEEKAAVKASAWVRMEKDEFKIINDRVDQRNAFADNIVALETAKAFFEKNPREGQAAFFDDEDVVKALERLKVRAERSVAKAQEEGLPAPVSPAVMALLMEVGAKAEAIHPLHDIRH